MIYAICDSGGRKTIVGNMLRIGSDPANQVVLQDPRVSPFHAILGEQADGLFIRDESSVSGTFVNQACIQGLVKLQIGDIISIAGAPFTVEQMPDQVFTPPPASQPAKKIGCGCLSMWPLVIIILLSLACILPVVGGYYLYKSDKATQQKVMTMIGQGPATVQIENLSDNTVFTFATMDLERQVKDTYGLFQWETNSYGVNKNANLQAGAYRIDFGTKSGEMDLGTCIFNLKSGEVYHFVVIPDYILIDRVMYPEVLDRSPASIGELVVETSSLCKFKTE